MGAKEGREGNEYPLEEEVVPTGDAQPSILQHDEF
jgi:hypothetical protein